MNWKRKLLSSCKFVIFFNLAQYCIVSQAFGGILSEQDKENYKSYSRACLEYHEQIPLYRSTLAAYLDMCDSPLLTTEEEDSHCYGLRHFIKYVGFRLDKTADVKQLVEIGNEEGDFKKLGPAAQSYYNRYRKVYWVNGKANNRSLRYKHRGPGNKLDTPGYASLIYQKATEKRLGVCDEIKGYINDPKYNDEETFLHLSEDWIATCKLHVNFSQDESDGDGSRAVLREKWLDFHDWISGESEFEWLLDDTKPDISNLLNSFAEITAPEPRMTDLTEANEAMSVADIIFNSQINPRNLSIKEAELVAKKFQPIVMTEGYFGDVQLATNKSKLEDPVNLITTGEIWGEKARNDGSIYHQVENDFEEEEFGGFSVVIKHMDGEKPSLLDIINQLSHLELASTSDGQTPTKLIERYTKYYYTPIRYLGKISFDGVRDIHLSVVYIAVEVPKNKEGFMYGYHLYKKISDSLGNPLGFNTKNIYFLKNKFQPVTIKDSIVREVEKPSSVHYAYLWAKNENLGKSIGSINDGEVMLHGIPHIKLNILTLHWWAYYGFFKPTLGEVIEQIPQTVIESVKSLYVTTDMPSGDVNSLTQGAYHLGITTLFIPKN